MHAHKIHTNMLKCEVRYSTNMLKYEASRGSAGKESARKAGDLGSIPGLERLPGEGNVYPLQYPCLQNPMDRGAWRAVIHGVAKSWTRLSN